MLLRIEELGIVSNRDLAGALANAGGKQRPIAEIILDRKIGSLPVVGDDGVMIGIVTETDFLAVAHNALHGRTGTGLLSA